MNKAQIRADTDDFINRSQGNGPYQIVISEDTDPRIKKALQNMEYDLTGAAQPLLPFYISVPGSDWYRVQVMLLINPETMNHGKTNTTNAAYTRQGFVTQLWGPNQDVLTATGKTAAFMVPGVGLSTFFRTRSAPFAFLNFMTLFNAYKNNGYRMLSYSKPELKEFTRVINVVQGVEIAYDGQIFTGHFTNFTLDETADNPYLMSYNFEFVVSTLSNDYNEVRGHFVPLPDKGQPPDNIPKELSQSPQDVKSTGNQTKLLSDVKKNGSEVDIVTAPIVFDQAEMAAEARLRAARRST